jgi:integrase
MLLAATGMRAVEALNICIKDIDFDNNPATIYVRGKNTKTKTDRILFLTKEVTDQLDSWLKYKYRQGRVCHPQYRDDANESENIKTITEYRTPSPKKTDMVFAVTQDNQTPDPNSFYRDVKFICQDIRSNGQGRKRIWQ